VIIISDGGSVRARLDLKCLEGWNCREGSVVTDSRGHARRETVGGDVKRLFKSLPGVGVGLARTWYDLGFR
jgi:hypothetical protein